MHCNFKGVNINNSYMANSFNKKMNIRIEFMIFRKRIYLIDLCKYVDYI